MLQLVIPVLPLLSIGQEEGAVNRSIHVIVSVAPVQSNGSLPVRDLGISGINIVIGMTFRCPLEAVGAGWVDIARPPILECQCQLELEVPTRYIAALTIDHRL